MKNHLTFRQADFMQMGLAGITENDMPRLTRQRVVNNKLMRHYAYMDGDNDPFYNFTTALTVAADQEYLKDAVTNGGTITAIDSTAKTITRSAGVFVAGSLVDVAIVIKASSLVAFHWTARITVGGATGTYEAISGSEGTFASATHMATVHVKKSLSTTAVDLSALYLKSIVKVWDDGLTGSKERVFFRTTDSRKFTEDHRNPDMDAEIRAYHRGDTLDLGVGESAPALANAQMEYRGKPNLYTDATEDDFILLPPEQNQILLDEMEYEYRKFVKKDIPNNLAERMEAYEKMFTAKLKDIAAREANKGKVSE